MEGHLAYAVDKETKFLKSTFSLYVTRQVTSWEGWTFFLKMNIEKEMNETQSPNFSSVTLSLEIIKCI